ncbi:MAG: SDR family NAD(P)-dependent oxidoreductase, partial [Mycobacterium sp.]
VADGEGIIAFPEAPKGLWHQYWSAPETVEAYLQQVARQRRTAFASGDASALYRSPVPRGEA